MSHGWNIQNFSKLCKSARQIMRSFNYIDPRSTLLNLKYLTNMAINSTTNESNHELLQENLEFIMDCSEKIVLNLCEIEEIEQVIETISFTLKLAKTKQILVDLSLNIKQLKHIEEKLQDYQFDKLNIYLDFQAIDNFKYLKANKLVLKYGSINVAEITKQLIKDTSELLIEQTKNVEISENSILNRQDNDQPIDEELRAYIIKLEKTLPQENQGQLLQRIIDYKSFYIEPSLLPIINLQELHLKNINWNISAGNIHRETFLFAPKHVVIEGNGSHHDYRAFLYIQRKIVEELTLINIKVNTTLAFVNNNMTNLRKLTVKDDNEESLELIYTIFSTLKLKPIKLKEIEIILPKFEIPFDILNYLDAFEVVETITIKTRSISLSQSQFRLLYCIHRENTMSLIDQNHGIIVQQIDATALSQEDKPKFQFIFNSISPSQRKSKIKTVMNPMQITQEGFEDYKEEYESQQKDLIKFTDENTQEEDEEEFFEHDLEINSDIDLLLPSTIRLYINHVKFPGRHMFVESSQVAIINDMKEYVSKRL
eukprot:403350195